MQLIPVPELVVTLVIALVVLGPRTLWRVTRRRLGRGAAADAGKNDSEIQQKRAQLIASCVIFVIISIPLILKMVPPNGLYGFRAPATRSSSAIWYSANAFAGWALSVAAVISAVLLVFLPSTSKRWLLWVTFVTPVVGALVASFWYLNRLM